MYCRQGCYTLCYCGFIIVWHNDVVIEAAHVENGAV